MPTLKSIRPSISELSFAEQLDITTAVRFRRRQRIATVVQKKKAEGQKAFEALTQENKMSLLKELGLTIDDLNMED